MASSAVNIDSQRGGQWCDAVEQINNKVQQVMSEVAQIIEDLGNSDKGGSIGEKLVKAAAGSICLILIWCGLKAKGAHYYGNEF